MIALGLAVRQAPRSLPSRYVARDLSPAHYNIRTVRKSNKSSRRRGYRGRRKYWPDVERGRSRTLGRHQAGRNASPRWRVAEYDLEVFDD